jgi:DNA polymerase alpha-associated DNA helicase A
MKLLTSGMFSISVPFRFKFPLSACLFIFKQNEIRGGGEGGEKNKEHDTSIRTNANNHRMNQTMTRMSQMQESEYSSFLRVMFGLSSPSPITDLEKEVEWIDPSLNDSQKDAIRFALGSREVALIHGPPGVGYLLCAFVKSPFYFTDIFYRLERRIH